VSAATALLAAVGPPLTAHGVRLLGATLRLRLAGLDGVAAAWRAHRPVIYAVWHGRILMVPWANARLRATLGARAPRVLASRSHDGELVARWVTRFGLAVVRGSSSRGGAAALRLLAAALRAGEDVAIVPDGPRGPRCRVQPGTVALGALTGAPIVPVAFAARPARRLATWDEFLVPLPFARAALVFGPLVEIKRDADRERARVGVEQALVDVTAAADRLVAT
jgi:lysophospholipid acyltransferase (LPLAT)-like uncharacterized protein